jgi:hypothetical protein
LQEGSSVSRPGLPSSVRASSGWRPDDSGTVAKWKRTELGDRPSSECVRWEPSVISIARQRSIRKVTAFRERYLADHTEATWFEAGLAYVMEAGRQQVGDVTEPAERDVHEDSDYASFVETARAFAQAEAPATGRFRVSSVAVPAWLRPAPGS